MKIYFTGISYLLFAIVATLGCQQSSDAQTSVEEDFLVTISTAKGDMKVILYDETPIHKANFIELAQSGKYDNTRWHRVIQNFMIQGGNIYESEGKIEPEEDRLKAEIVPGLMHTKGALAAARMGDQINPEKKSSSSQFYIVHGRKFSEEELTSDQYRLNLELSRMFENPAYDSLKMLFVDLQRSGGTAGDMNELALSCLPYVEKELNTSLRLDVDSNRVAAYSTLGGAPHLDNAYTIFGRVVEGLEVIDSIASLPTGQNDEPIERLGMKMKVEIVKRTLITDKYGYVYPEKR